MKITKRQFKRIIREYRGEGEEQSMQELKNKLFAAIDEYVMVLDEVRGYDVSLDELKAAVLDEVESAFAQFERDREDQEAPGFRGGGN